FARIPTSGHRLVARSLHFHFHLVIAASSRFPVRPRTGRRRRYVVAAQVPLLRGSLAIIRRQQVRKVGVINIALVEFFRGRTLEGVGGSLVDERGQEFSLAVRQEHWLIPRVSL